MLPVSLIPVANYTIGIENNFPPVSTTQAKLVEKFAARVVDTGGNFAPVSLTLVVHLDLQISPPIFKKIRKGPNRILWGWIHEKTRSKKSCDTVHLEKNLSMKEMHTRTNIGED